MKNVLLISSFSDYYNVVDEKGNPLIRFNLSVDFPFRIRRFNFSRLLDLFSAIVAQSDCNTPLRAVPENMEWPLGGPYGHYKVVVLSYYISFSH